MSWYHFAWVFVGAMFYRFPASKMTVIGVTGTNGKSTTVEMISRILREAGLQTCSISSIRFQMGEKEWRNRLKMTMPGRFVVQKFLRQAVNDGCTHAVIEVTSEGILQHRHRFLNFHGAVFTNLSPEHIERHGGFENYKAAKGKLFQIAKGLHVVNGDNEHATYFLQFPAHEKYVYRLKHQHTEYEVPIQNSKVIEADVVCQSSEGVGFLVGQTKFSLSLLGEFNVYNALAAIGVGLSQGISLETCKKALEKIAGVPGRMELVIGEPFRVFVDYAFTPVALEKVYQTLSTEYKLICVLGAAGGGRDKWKRPLLGKIAGAYCNTIIVTNEDPYDEDPQEIIDQVAKGTGGKAEKILDRREAIKKALKIAREGDTVIITGKGCEDSLVVAGGKKIPWDDREAVREEFQKLSRFRYM